MADVLGLHVNEKDNVATVFSNDAACGTEIRVLDKTGAARMVRARTDIPYGHKLAVRAIARGEDIVKYGQVIGRATADIAAGEHVHVHNLESCRGRGDWEKGEA